MTGRFFSHFPRGKAFLPVVHAETFPQTRRNVELCLGAGADGVFLIGHGMEPETLLDVYGEVRSSYPDAWLGINFLCSIPEAIALLPGDVQAHWYDDGGMGRSPGSEAHRRAEHFQSLHQQCGFSGLTFGGVAFKGMPQPVDLESVSKDASRLMDVVTTSGPGTGYAADVEKILRMRTALGAHPMGLASGVSLENIHEVLPLVDAFLVASSLCLPGDFHNFDASKVEAMARVIRSWEG